MHTCLPTEHSEGARISEQLYLFSAPCTGCRAQLILLLTGAGSPKSVVLPSLTPSFQPLCRLAVPALHVEPPTTTQRRLSSLWVPGPQGKASDPAGLRDPPSPKPQRATEEGHGRMTPGNLPLRTQGRGQSRGEGPALPQRGWRR